MHSLVVIEATRWLAAQAPDQGNPLLQLGIMLLPMLGIIYFMMIRPQSKQQEEHKTFLSTLQKGQEVVTYGGILGKVHSVSDTAVTIEIAKDTRIQVLKNYVYAVPAQQPAVTGTDQDKKALDAKK